MWQVVLKLIRMVGKSVTEMPKERMSRIEDTLRECSGEEGTVSMWVEKMLTKLQIQRNMVEPHDKYVEEKIINYKRVVQSKIKDFM